MSEKAQFDSLLGGSRELPGSVNLMRFTASRSKEIIAMQSALSCMKGTKLAFQKLPKHMRRRVMSHNAKRLPRRLREIHLSQLKKSGMPPKHKKPSRKHRRRRRILTSASVRKNRKHKWLETHIWHAKRFRMTERWGYRLPDRPCDKAFRACYRATAKHCLIQDISYYSCLEVEGPYQLIINNLKRICDSSTGLTVAAKAFTKGNREGEIMLFHDAIPKKAIGSVYFQWKPFTTTEDRTLWLWIHAAFYNEAYNAILACFESHPKEVFIRELKYALNRLRLTGPLASSILQFAFKTVDATMMGDVDWLNSYLANDDSRQTFSEQLQFWKSLRNVSSTAEISPHIILSLVVSDPRYHFPTKRRKALPDCESTESAEVLDVPELCSSGPIWSKQIRDVVTDGKISNAAIARLRSDLLVPGTQLPQSGAPIPVMLIQRPGNDANNLGYCSGWDLIVPSGWSQPTWLSLVMWGARPGGLRESTSVVFEMGKPSLFAPDTIAGVEEEDRISQDCKRRYFSLPPKKRVNYNKFAIASPFTWRWKMIIKEWGETRASAIEDFFVLRDLKQLNLLQEKLKSKAALPPNSVPSLNCIVPVKLTLKRGKPGQFAVICVPEDKDFMKNNEPTEPLRADENQHIRKSISNAHKSLLKQLKRRRKKARREGKVLPIDNEVLLNFKTKIRDLWLPEPKNVRNSCCRDVMGFITKGDFTLTVGSGTGVGYVAMGALKHLLTHQRDNRVLVRNTNSREYRAATIEIAM